MTLPFPFRRHRPRVPESEAFHSPLPTPARTALLDTGFRAGPGMNEFSPEELPGLRVWSPAVLVAPLGLVLSLADQKSLGLFNLPSLNTAIVVLTSVDQPPLSNHHRDLLWRAFAVPVFEQLRASDGMVIARECEVHDGLHIFGSHPNLRGEIVTSQCACGQETPRLKRRFGLHSNSAAA